jgi:hypothetical protein
MRRERIALYWLKKQREQLGKTAFRSAERSHRYSTGPEGPGFVEEEGLNRAMRSQRNDSRAEVSFTRLHATPAGRKSERSVRV